MHNCEPLWTRITFNAAFLIRVARFRTAHTTIRVRNIGIFTDFTGQALHAERTR